MDNFYNNNKEKYFQLFGTLFNIITIIIGLIANILLYNENKSLINISLRLLFIISVVMLIFYYVKKDIIIKDYLSINNQVFSCYSINEETKKELSENQKVICNEKKILLNNKYKETEKELLPHIDLYFWLSLVPYIITVILALTKIYIPKK